MTPEWTPEMQRLWNRAMLLARTECAYGVALPQPGATYPPLLPGDMARTILFAATATEEEYNTYLEAVREDMLAWKARLRSGTRTVSLDLTGVEFKI